MISIKINGKQSDLPTCWEELTLSQYLDILKVKKEEDYPVLISKFLKLDYNVIRDAVLIGFEQAMMAFSFLETPVEWKGHPEKIGKYILPKDITIESIAQYEDMKAVTKNRSIEELVEKYPLICAIYCQKLRDGYYDFAKAQELADEFQNANAKEIIEAASFFLTKLFGLMNGIPMNSPHGSKNQEVKKRTGFIKLLASLRSFIPSQKKLI